MAPLIMLVIELFVLLITARVLMSWVQVDPYHPVAQAIFNATEPFLRPVRELVPPVGGLDLSPMILITLVIVIGQILVSAF